jgi:hypothetical protein
MFPIPICDRFIICVIFRLDYGCSWNKTFVMLDYVHDLDLTMDVLYMVMRTAEQSVVDSGFWIKVMNFILSLKVEH